ncbi:MAG: DUF5688 family protein [Wujia sp.]
MEFAEFCETVRNEIADYLMQYDIENVRIQQIDKNNGITMTGLLITQQGSDIAPSIYLEKFHYAYSQGRSMESILQEISGVYRDACMQINRNDISFLEDADAYYDRVYLKVVNYEKNKDMLRDVPFQKNMDMAVTMRVLVNQGPEHTASTQLTYPMIARMELNQKKLWEQAVKNTKDYFPVRIERLDNLIRSLEPEGMDEPIPNMGIYVLTNKDMVYGATAILYAQEELKKLARENNTSYYILPSSVNEVLLVPEREYPDAEKLQIMVAEINMLVVKNEEILSDSVYRYDKDSGEISMAFPETNKELENDGRMR